MNPAVYLGIALFCLLLFDFLVYIIYKRSRGQKDRWYMRIVEASGVGSFLELHVRGGYVYPARRFPCCFRYAPHEVIHLVPETSVGKEVLGEGIQWDVFASCLIHKRQWGKIPGSVIAVYLTRNRREAQDAYIKTITDIPIFPVN